MAGKIVEEQCLKDVIYCTTQHLELKDKEIALLNDKLEKSMISLFKYYKIKVK